LGHHTHFAKQIEFVEDLPDPLTSVVLGVGKILDELDLLRKVSVMSQYSSSR